VGPVTLLDRLRQALGTTASAFGRRLAEGEGISPDVLEEALIVADAGVELAAELAEELRRLKGKRGLAGAEEREWLAARLREALPAAVDGPLGSPHVVLVVGVNGSGKTTTAAKLAGWWRQQGKSVLMVAADTFRAAAIEQLQQWGERLAVPVVAQRPGADPGAVAYDGLRLAMARGVEVVIVDTAGRLHTKHNLMAELEKIRTVCGRAVAGAPHEVLLVLDATTGGNALAQAAEFRARAGVTGVVLTKLDGTAKGGVVLAVGRQLGVPVRWVGVGEGVDDLLPFDAEAFVQALLAGVA